ncbi:hypothetical protein LDENG_00023150 [Lucifuga dentata]|nr:hypothetical protein LDENG_00023150 [Lucifuga dentata]
MDRSSKDKKRKQRRSNHSSIEEPEYDVVDGQEDVLNVHIHPARPMNTDREYADRDLPRSSYCSGNCSILPKCPPRQIPITSGPAINRDLKPSRRKTKLDDIAPAVQPREQLSQRSSTPFMLELPNRFSGLSLQKPCRRDGQKATKKAEFSSHTKVLQCVESADLETQNHMDQRSHLDLERASSKRQDHEQPQTKEDFDQHKFVPMEKPEQTYYEEDWYVGACSRADAEHALHLVNKDGAFLVRDCSNNTNSEPMVLAVYHEKKVYNVKIRFMESTSKYALGTGQRSNDMFDSVADIIKFHSIFPIILISGRNMAASKYPDNCVLTFPITKKDVDQLLR